MPQITINSTNIEQFGWSATFDPALQTITFDTASLTTYNDVSGTGSLYVLGISFAVTDQQGVVLSEVDWNSPQIQPALGETAYTLDLASVGLDFFFQTYKIIGYIKDGDGQVYSTTAIYPKICQPVGINSNGVVDGLFQVTANCPDNVLTVKEVTPFVYDNKIPESVSKTGHLYYPTGTISPVDFSGTPFTNNTIYQGQYRIVCTTVGVYSLGNDIYVAVTYYTNNVFDLTCSNKVQDILCCLVDLQRTKTANCNNAVGERAAQQLASIEIPFFIAISKEISGQDASEQVAFIRKTLNCNCGGSSIIRNEFSPLNNEPNPIDPTVTTILIQGAGGTSVANPVINGNTKTFTVKSNVYQVVKGNNLDTSFSITVDTATLNTVKYKIAFDYTVLSQTILTQIAGNSSLLSQFNSLVNITNFNIDLTNLDGKCVIDLSADGQFMSQLVPSGASQILNIIINGTTYTAPGGSIILSDTSSIETWLNGLGLGSFIVSFSNAIGGAYINILTVANGNTVTSCLIGISAVIDQPDSFVTATFKVTNKSLIAVLQAIVDYICSLSALEVTLGQPESFSYIDYNGNTVSYNFSANDTQAAFNDAIANVFNTLQLLNNSFVNALNRVNGVVKWGGQLTDDTVIDQNGKTIQFDGNSNSLVRLNLANMFTSYRQGTAGSDFINVVLNAYYVWVAEIATNDDRAAISYYAKATQINKIDPGVGARSLIGINVPTSNDGAFPAPPNDPDTTAYIEGFYNEATSTPEVNAYGKKFTHTGDEANFGSLLSVKQMTTTQRDAIDVSLLTVNRIIFNTTVNKHQAWDLSTWNNLY